MTATDRFFYVQRSTDAGITVYDVTWPGGTKERFYPEHICTADEQANAEAIDEARQVAEQLTRSASSGVRKVRDEPQA